MNWGHEGVLIAGILWPRVALLSGGCHLVRASEDMTVDIIWEYCGPQNCWCGHWLCLLLSWSCPYLCSVLIFSKAHPQTHLLRRQFRSIYNYWAPLNVRRCVRSWGDKGDTVFAFELSLVGRNRYTNSFKQIVVLRNKLGKTEPID